MCLLWLLVRRYRNMGWWVDAKHSTLLIVIIRLYSYILFVSFYSSIRIWPKWILPFIPSSTTVIHFLNSFGVESHRTWVKFISSFYIAELKKKVRATGKETILWFVDSAVTQFSIEFERKISFIYLHDLLLDDDEVSST